MGLWNKLQTPTRTPEQRSLNVLLALCILATITVLTITLLKRPYHFDVDSGWYIKLSRWQIGKVIRPFSMRILHPFVVSLFQKAFGLGTDSAFLAIAIASAATFVCCVTLIGRSQIPLAMIFMMLMTPFLFNEFADYFLPDFFHAALMSVFFVLLYLRKHAAAIAVMLLLSATRESTLLLAGVACWCSARRSQWDLTIGLAASAAIGTLAIKFVASYGLPNIHGMNDLLYMALKIPYNASKNVFGVVFWSDTLAANQPQAFPNAPVLVVSSPQFLSKSSWIRAIGIYEFSWQPLATLIGLLSTFGTLPTVLIRDLTASNFRRRFFSEAPLWAVIALIVGLLSFGLGIVAGASVHRLISYGWPAFFIAFPCMLHQQRESDRNSMTKLFAASTIAAWLPSFPYLADYQTSISASIILLCGLIALHAFSLRVQTHNQ
jgi:hypothetical protein